MKKNVFSKLFVVILSLALVFSAAACHKNTDTSSISKEAPVSGDSAAQTSESGISDIGITSQEDTSSLTSGTGTSSTPTTSSSAGGINAKPTASPSKTGFVKPSYNLKGRNIILWGATQPKSGTIEYASWKDVEAQYNCTLTFKKVTYSVAVTKQTAAALSGTSECDIWYAQWYDVFPSFLAKGMAAPLSDYYDFVNDPAWSGSDGNNNNYWNGKLYGLNNGVSGPAWGLWYNKKLLAKENLEDPASLVKKNAWTWDKFLDMCKKLTKDTNGDKKTDQWGYYDEYLFINMILTNGGEIIDVSNKNGPAFTMNSAATNYAIRYAVDMANKYGVVPSIGSIGDPTLLEMFPKGQVAFTTYAPAYGPLCVSKGMNPSDLGYTYFPKGPNAKDYVVHAPTMDAVYLIPPQVKDIKPVACVLQDYLCVWDKTEKFAVPKSDLLDVQFATDSYGVIYDNNKNFMLNGGSKNKPSYINNFFLGDLLNTSLLYPLIRSEIEVESGIKSVTPKIQTKIDELVNQTLK